MANRAGTGFVVEVKDSTKRIRLIKFVYNAEQTYVLEFGHLYIRFIQNGAQVVVAGPAWSSLVAYEPGDLVTNLTIVYVAILAGTNHVPAGSPTYWHALGSSGVLNYVSPYSESELPNIQYTQSGDVVTITHPNHPPYELRRTAYYWSFTAVSFVPAIGTPQNLVASGGTAGAASYEYVVTAISSTTGEESLASASDTAVAKDDSQLDWDAVSGASEYNVYRRIAFPATHPFGFVAVATTNSFLDDTAVASDETIQPPVAFTPFDAAQKYPRAVSYFQQRQLFGGTITDPETVWASRTGIFHNFGYSTPLQDDDGLSFTLVGKTVNEVRHMLDLGQLLVFASGAIWLIEGDSAGILRPGEVNSRVLSRIGIDEELAPLVLDNVVLYVESLGSLVRSLTNDVVNGYSGTDMCVFAAHLFQGFTLVDWDFQQNPHSIVYGVRDDGTLLGLTFLREHEIWGWHRHDTDGLFENVVVVPEGTEDAVYVVVNRTIEGATKRYIERFASREFDDITDAFFVDSGLSYDGTNTSATTMTLSGGIGWTYDELLTITASAAFFSAGDVGNAIDFPAATDGTVRVTIEGYTSSTVVTGRASRTVPANVRNAATTVWGRAVDQFSGLDHLEGKDVAAIGDGYVAASPNNPDYAIVTVTAGVATFDGLYVKMHIGLPYLSDLETLDIDTPSGPSRKESRMLVGAVRFFLERSRGVFAGRRAPTGSDATEGLYELKRRQYEALGTPTEMVTDDVRVIIRSNWDSNGRVFLRQVDPLPLTVLSVTPQGYL